MLSSYLRFLSKHYFKLLKYGLISFLSTTTIVAQSTTNNLEISLLTCESGDALYSTFGHTAIRVIDKTNHKDLVFDFGNFDFNTPFFALKFLRGSLDYHLSVVNFSSFQSAYQRTKRGVVEQRLLLDKENKQQIYQQLKHTLKSESRYYKYDFLNDNCATRIRDIIDKLPVEKPPFNITTTHRKELKTYLIDKKWLGLGIDILLGMPVDKTITQKELMFLPNQLREQLSQYQINGQPLLGTSRVIVKSNDSTITRWKFFQPLYWAIFIFSSLLFLVIKDAAILPKITNLLYSTFGLSGLLLLFLWFGTRHAATQMNYNILWLNPFYLITPFIKKGRLKKFFLQAIILINSLLLLFWIAAPQVFNLAIIPLIGMILLVALTEIRNERSLLKN